MTINRYLPVGAEVISEGVSFRVWAPKKQRVEIVIKNKDLINGETKLFDMKSEGNGYFSLVTAEAEDGNLYWFRLDDSRELYPDPASRFQPEGPHGPSEIIDHNKYIWKDENWEGVKPGKEVIYEMHIGTFTEEGTFRSAMEHLKYLSELGITVIEMMPVADFPGKFGWGYDGVNLFAPTRLYGRPDELREFIDTAHLNKLAVILDVVYNHLGPDGNYLREFSPYYFTHKYKTDWGEALNFDGQDSGPVRDYFISNAEYWIEEYHFDGLRLDATQDIHDVSAPHILSEITKKVRDKGKKRRTYVIGENEPQLARLIKSSDEGGYGIDALWNDDFHHSAIVALTGRNEAYYSDYKGKPQEFISALKYGFLYQGQYYKWQKKNRGSSSLNVDHRKLIYFIENHDQVANSARGQRIHQRCSASIYRAISSVMILGPGTPLLFQGQEFVSSKPFYYFADHNPELADTICSGRIAFLSQFRSITSPEIIACIPDPVKPDTFKNSKLDHSEKKTKEGWLLFHKELLHLRKNDIAFNEDNNAGIDGAVLGDQAFLIRYFVSDGSDRIMLVNLGTDFEYCPSPEPLIAPPEGMVWELLWSSENPKYGGNGNPDFIEETNWIIPGQCSILFKPVYKGGRIDATTNKIYEMGK